MKRARYRPMIMRQPDSEGFVTRDGVRTYYAVHGDGPQTQEIHIMNADGSSLRNLTRHPAQDNFVAWSPDSKRIAFISNRDGGHDVYVMDVD